MFSVFIPSESSPRTAAGSGGQGGGAVGRDRGADPGGHAGDRDFQPALYRERRALHDGHTDVRGRHPESSHHGGDLHSRQHRLVTVRYDAPKPFMLVENKLARACAPGITGEMVLMELLDAVIDRNADILERAGSDMDTISHDIFEPEGAARTGHAKRYSDILIAIGRKGDLTSKVRESLVSIGRVVTFVAAAVDGVKWSKDMREQLKTMQRDVTSLTDHASYLSNKITFVLDAMLGVVNLEQNNIIKLFSVMAVVLMPPTLIASIYGMNFKGMPELDWPHGYTYALVSMLLAAAGPYMYFKWKKWLWARSDNPTKDLLSGVKFNRLPLCITRIQVPDLATVEPA